MRLFGRFRKESQTRMAAAALAVSQMLAMGSGPAAPATKKRDDNSQQSLTAKQSAASKRDRRAERNRDNILRQREGMRDAWKLLSNEPYPEVA